ncbi:MAG: UDP-galactopyranose mutase [Clostridiales bacterium]|nr:UDP-galactopyranose mutase [Clostridiales bacterium]
MKYDYIIVGAGLFGAVCARELTDAGKKVLVVDRRSHLGGNIYTEKIAGINVHKYGAHIFHTNSAEAWNYVNRFAAFNRYTNAPVANYKGEIYPLPFNMHTFNRLWGVITPQEAQKIISEQKKEIVGDPQNLEQQAISLVGRDIYEKLVRDYTQKQWGRPCDQLPAFIIRRLPVRFTYDTNYFDALYQGIPTGGYTRMVANMLNGVETLTDVDYLKDREHLRKAADRVIFTGAIDEYFDYQLGEMEYRRVEFETEALDTDNYQGCAVVNYTDSATPFTRIIEHKWFEFGKDETGQPIPGTVISREYSRTWKRGEEPYYPVNDAKNADLYSRYKALADGEKGVYFGGRLGQYRYFDMDATILSALELVKGL